MNLGKVELHLHLDGTLDLETAFRLALNRQIIDDTWTMEQFKQKMTVPSDNPSLEECLKCFDFQLRSCRIRKRCQNVLIQQSVI